MKKLLIAVVALVALNGAAFADTGVANTQAGFETTAIGFVLNQDNLKAELKAEVLKNVKQSVKDSIEWNNTVALEHNALETEFVASLQEQVKNSIRASLEACCV